MPSYSRTDLDNALAQVNQHSAERLEIRSAYGKVGLSSTQTGRDVTPLVTKNELGIFLDGVMLGVLLKRKGSRRNPRRRRR